MDNSFLLYSTYKDVCHCGLNIFANLQKDLKVFRFLLCGICFYRAHVGIDRFGVGCASGFVAGFSS